MVTAQQLHQRTLNPSARLSQLQAACEPRMHSEQHQTHLGMPPPLPAQLAPPHCPSKRPSQRLHWSGPGLPQLQPQGARLAHCARCARLRLLPAL